jgi:anti-sigma regulatory factor (Ser/Thr protein kinase)
MKELVEDVVEITRSKWKNEAQGKGLSIEVDTEFAHTASIDGNAAELREALTNLIINAVDAMPRGGRLAFRTGDERVDERDMVRMEVSDTGQGIPHEVQAQIFDPFFSTKGNLGTGLGLSITYGIVTRHGGTITVESVPDEGTTFVLRLPVGTAVPGAGEAAADEEIPFVPATVLVVDDEPRSATCSSRGSAPPATRSRRSDRGARPSPAWVLVHYDVVLTDLGMPEVTGWDVVAAARTTRPK